MGGQTPSGSHKLANNGYESTAFRTHGQRWPPTRWLFRGSIPSLALQPDTSRLPASHSSLPPYEWDLVLDRRLTFAQTRLATSRDLSLTGLALVRTTLRPRLRSEEVAPLGQR